MRATLLRFFGPPVFSEDEDQTRAAATINALSWSALVILISLLVMRIVQGQDVNLVEVNLVLTAIILAIAIVLLLIHRGTIQVASVLLVLTAWIGLSYVAWIADGIRDVTFVAYTVPILLAGLLLGWRAALLVTGISILSGWILAYAQASGLFLPTLDTPLNFARDMTGVFALTGVLIYLTISSLQSAASRARAAAQQLVLSNEEVNDLKRELEHKVEERTFELQKRATQLEAVSGVARAIASVQDLDNLLPTIARLVSQQFEFYHVAIFLPDEQEHRAVLRAANDAAGMRLIEQKFSLPLDQHSIVGYSFSTAEPRVALDVELEAAYHPNPNLPETRSEVALPLRVADRVIGCLDVQSREVNAFSQEDIAVLATLADQIAIAIENARLFGDARTALDESRALFEKYTRQEWGHFARQVKQPGFTFDGKQIAPLDRHVKREPARTVIQTGNLALEKETASIAIPIKIRGQTIGVLDVRSKKGSRPWKQDEIAMLEAAAERAALALENARLIESAQRRAARERAIGDISSKIGAVSSIESILQTAVEELGRKLGGATEVTVEINSGDANNNL